jgi:hypothetical protein
MSNTVEQDSSSANQPADPLEITRDAARLMACSRGLYLLFSSPFLLALGALQLTDRKTSGNLNVLISLAYPLFVIFGPRIISWIRTRQGTRFRARGESLRRTITPGQAAAGIGAAVTVFVLIGVFVWWTKGSKMVPQSILMGILLFFSLLPIIRFTRLRLWEDLLLSVSILGAAGAVLINYGSESFAAMFLILGFCSLIAGTSLEKRWRHWSRQAAVDDPSSEPKPEK